MPANAPAIARADPPRLCALIANALTQPHLERFALAAAHNLAAEPNLASALRASAPARAALAAWNGADADRDGRLSRDEFRAAALDDEQRVASFVGVWGTSISVEQRPDYGGRVDPGWDMVADNRDMPPIPKKFRGRLDF